MALRQEEVLHTSDQSLCFDNDCHETKNSGIQLHGLVGVVENVLENFVKKWENKWEFA